MYKAQLLFNKNTNTFLIEYNNNEISFDKNGIYTVKDIYSTNNTIDIFPIVFSKIASENITVDDELKSIYEGDYNLFGIVYDRKTGSVLEVGEFYFKSDVNVLEGKDKVYPIYKYGFLRLNKISKTLSDIELQKISVENDSLIIDCGNYKIAFSLPVNTNSAISELLNKTDFVPLFDNLTNLENINYYDFI